jgi:hypothetical protein
MAPTHAVNSKISANKKKYPDRKASSITNADSGIHAAVTSQKRLREDGLLAEISTTVARGD